MAVCLAIPGILSFVNLLLSEFIPEGICGAVLVHSRDTYFAQLLDTLGIGVCVFDENDCTQHWNQTFLDFFPEHDGHVFAGEAYAANLRRFYQGRLPPEELPLIDRYIADGIARHRGQSRPFIFNHLGRRLRVASLPSPDGGRMRIWQELTDSEAASSVSPVPSPLSIDLLNHIADGAMVLDANDRIIATNMEFRVLYDVPLTQSIIGMTFGEIVARLWHGDEESIREKQCSIANRLRYAEAPFEIELPGEKWRRVIARRNADGIGYFTHSDITPLKRQYQRLQQAEERSRQEEHRYRLLAENASDVIVSVTADHRIAFISPASTRILGWAPEELEGEALAALVHENDHTAFGLDSTRGLGRAHVQSAFLCRIIHQNGDWVWMEASLGILPEGTDESEGIAFVCVLRDATERVTAELALKRLHDELAELASTDALTGLANRRHFEIVFQREWKRAVRDASPFCLMMLDIDHFKAVNDRFGHPAGDECLRMVAQVIQQSAVRRPADFAARYGGEEFAVLLPDTSGDGALSIADRVRLALLAKPWVAVDPELDGITISIGICAVTPTKDLEATEVMRVADEMLYRAKANGRDRAELMVLAGVESEALTR